MNSNARPARTDQYTHGEAKEKAAGDIMSSRLLRLVGRDELALRRARVVGIGGGPTEMRDGGVAVCEDLTVHSW